MHASRFIAIETANRLRFVSEDQSRTPLSPFQRRAVLDMLRGPFKKHESGKHEGRTRHDHSNADIRALLKMPKLRKDQWPKLSTETEDEKSFPGDWFHREVVLGVFGMERWHTLATTPAGHEAVKYAEAINRAILRFDPDEPTASAKLENWLACKCACTNDEASRVVEVWKRRAPVQSRLNRSRRAIRNLLTIMDVDPSNGRASPSEVEARREIALSTVFVDATNGKPLDSLTRQRYLRSTRGLNREAIRYSKKHGGKLPPPQMLMNPVVRKSIHEAKAHLEAIRARYGTPHAVVVELFRDAKMGKKELDRHNKEQARRASVRLGVFRAFGPEHGQLADYDDNILRALLAVQQKCRCALCGKTMVPGQEECAAGGITLLTAFNGTGCELAHIFPISRGGPKGTRNMVLAHTDCNQHMGAKCPREWWGEEQYKENVKTWLGRMYNDPPEWPMESDKSDKEFRAWWPVFFSARDNRQKLAMFGKTAKDFKEFSEQQRNDTRAATRSVMRFIADGLYGGEGLPEDSPGTGTEVAAQKRKVFARDGLIGKRLKEEWGLVFEVHGGRVRTGAPTAEQREAAEKDRRDHRHHAVDAVVLALASDKVIAQWHKREREALSQPGGTAAAKAYRRDNPIYPPGNWGGKGATFEQAVRALRAEVQRAVYGGGTGDRPVVHRPEGTRIRGGFHEDSLMSPAAGRESPRFVGDPAEAFVDSIRVAELKAEHLRLPTTSTPESVLERLIVMHKREGKTDRDAKAAANVQLAAMNGNFGLWAEMDPSPGKGGLVVSLRERKRLRKMIESFEFERRKQGGGPDEKELYRITIEDFTKRHAAEMAAASAFRDSNGVPILKVKRLRVCKRPVFDGPQPKLGMSNADLRRLRAFVGGAIHHAAFYLDAKGKTASVGVPMDEAAKRNTARLNALTAAGVPSAYHLRRAPRVERREHRDTLRRINVSHPIVDARDDPKRGKFLMSLAMGETLWMRPPGDPSAGYFVVVKIDVNKSGSAKVVLVPHWDARPSKERRSLVGKEVEFSRRRDVELPPSKLKEFAAPGHDFPIKVRTRLYSANPASLLLGADARSG
ncbi:MAG: hypothetical protein IT438_06505 [Phycisphaerales bacterium]|nr:hypothetical protein [Phycisphaerales bacterium]